MIFWAPLLSGIGFGFVVAAPVGPMSLLCMNRTLQQGFRAGLATGFGIALADAVYALVTVSAFKAVNDFTSIYALPLRLSGSLLLGLLGAKSLLRGESTPKPDSPRSSGIPYCLLSSFLLTLANPATLLSFAALSVSLGTTAGSSWFLPAGIAAGSGCWWLLFVSILKWISGKLPASFTRWLNLSSAAILILFSLYGILTALNGMDGPR
ncbi:LysE family translocator [Paenibacillus sonchi]|uniref:LysE family translocator n=1 Tax=Paenibacillus sonchi TaxID=373687 RepID=UPI001E467D5A|nr:LysE family transporter [Paenibacillus sonchi]MCE3200228.1 LysE family transporter [Paenibacillus sonchi]